MRRAVLRPKSLAAFVALLTVIALVPMVIAFACTPLARFTLSPDSGLPGDTIAVTNTSNFQSKSDPVSKVVLRWNASNGPILWSGQPNADGTLPAISFQVPSVSPSDGYTVIAYPYGADGTLMMNGNTPPSPIHSNAPFTVSAPPAAQSSAPAAQAPAAPLPAPAQASNSAAASQAEPPVAAAPVAPAPAAAGSGPVGNARNQEPGGSTTPSSHSPSVSAKPSAGSSGGIAILSALVAVIAATTAVLLVWIRRRRARRQPAVARPVTPAPLLPDDRVSAGAELSGYAVEPAREPSAAGDLVGAAPSGRLVDE